MAQITPQQSMSTFDAQKQLISDFYAAFKKQISDVDLIRENSYCYIFGARLENRRVIVKQYKEKKSELASVESKACDFYSTIADPSPNLISGKTLFFNFERSLLCLSFVRGDRLSDAINQSVRLVNKRSNMLVAMGILGEFMSATYRKSADNGEKLDPFYFEYITHCASKLSEIPIAGGTIFRNCMETTIERIEQLQGEDVRSCFAHRDFVFQNIHVDGHQVGVIDFANSTFNGHFLDDYYGLYTALNAMLIPTPWKQQLWDAFLSSLQVPEFSKSEHMFFETYHRLRWLWLHHLNGQTHQWVRRLFGNLSISTASTTTSSATGV